MGCAMVHNVSLAVLLLSIQWNRYQHWAKWYCWHRIGCERDYFLFLNADSFRSKRNYWNLRLWHQGARLCSKRFAVLTVAECCLHKQQESKIVRFSITDFTQRAKWGAATSFPLDSSRFLYDIQTNMYFFYPKSFDLHMEICSDNLVAFIFLV